MAKKKKTKKKNKSKHKPKIEAGGWGVYVFDEADYPVIYRVCLAPELDGLHALVTLQWPYEPIEHGMPSEALMQVFEEFENVLEIAESQAEVVLTAIITGNSRREWQLYTAAPETLLALLKQVLPDGKSLPMHIATTPDPEHVAWQALRQREA